MTASMIDITTTTITASASALSSVVGDTTATPLAGTKRPSSSLGPPFLSRTLSPQVVVIVSHPAMILANGRLRGNVSFRCSCAKMRRKQQQWPTG
jgi:hypothetical protein